MLRIDAICGTSRPSISKPGSSSAGCPQNDIMLASCAPASIAIRWPSPSLCGGLSGMISWPMKPATICLFHSKPPLASTTPRRAPMNSSPSAPSTRTPMTAPSTTTRSWAAVRVCASTPRSSSPLNSDAASAAPSTRVSLSCAAARDRHPAGRVRSGTCRPLPSSATAGAARCVPATPTRRAPCRPRTAPVRSSVPPAFRRAGRRSSRRSREAPTSSAGSWSRGSRASRRRCRRRSR